MGRAKRYPSIAVVALLGFAKGSTHPASYLFSSAEVKNLVPSKKRFGRLNTERRSVGRMRNMDVAARSPHEVTRANAALRIFQRSFKHEGLFERRVLVQWHGPRRASSTGSFDDVLSKDGASMVVVTALPRHSTMCVYFDSSYRCRTRSPDIARTWKSYSRFVRGYPHTTDNPMRAQLPETRCRARSCKR
jgi:hypothetical protein